MTLRALLVSTLALAAVVLAGCGNKPEVRTLGETEGIYVDVGGLSYQVQLSRILNPDDAEDASYLADLPAGVTPPTAEETWFAIFMRVNNPSEEELPVASSYRILDTQENEYRPVTLDTRRNPFAFQTGPIPGGEIRPDPNSISGEGDIQGSLILFKLDLGSLQNRPLELMIDDPVSPSQSTSATIDLDV